MSTFKDLPPGSREWAHEVNKALEELTHLTKVVRKAADDLGINYADPTIVRSDSSVPSAQKSVQLKLPSLKDLEIRDAVDGDVLTFDGLRGVWTARQHDTIIMPKEFELGDPLSYYEDTEVTPDPDDPGDEDPDEPPAEDPITLADKSATNSLKYNEFTNPSFENGTATWSAPSTDPFYYTHAEGVFGSPDYTETVVEGTPHQNQIGGISAVSGDSREGSKAMRITLGYAPGDAAPETGDPVNLVLFNNLPDVRNVLLYFKIPASGQSTPVVARVESHAFSEQNGAARKVLKTVSTTVEAGDWAPVYLYMPEGTQNTSVRLALYFGSISTDRSGLEILMDTTLASSNTATYFDGDSAAVEGYSTAWEGAPHASRSVMTMGRQLKAPSTITLGKPFYVEGSGYGPGEAVTVMEYQWGNTYTEVTADAAGQFKIVMTIPANTDPDAGPIAGPGGGIFVYGDASQAMPEVTGITYV